MHDGKVSAEIDIRRPAEDVFDFLVSPQKIPLVLPGLVENTDIPPLPLVPGSRFRYRYQMYGVMLEGSWICRVVERPSRYEAETDGDVPSSWLYELSERSGTTHVSLLVTYETPRSLVSRIKSDVLVRINQQEADAYFQNLKTVLEMTEEG